MRETRSSVRNSRTSPTSIALMTLFNSIITIGDINHILFRDAVNGCRHVARVEADTPGILKGSHEFHDVRK